LGSTGAMMPKARKSNATVMRMKTKAARVAARSGVGEDKGRSSESMIVAGNDANRYRFDAERSRRNFPVIAGPASRQREKVQQRNFRG
jgi:hypothetical protein